MDLKSAEIINFLEFLSNGEHANKIVSIPHYQRPYTWKPENVRTLIDDWYEGGKEEYFAGAVVNVLLDSKVELVDGQQRFTTSFLVNYVRFLLLRVYIRELLIQHQTSQLLTMVQELHKSTALLFINYTSEQQEEITNKVTEQLAELDETKAEEEKDQVRAKLQESVGEILKIPMSQGDSYQEETAKQLNQVFEKYDLVLQYARSSYNNAIKQDLSSITIELSSQQPPEMTFPSDEKSINDGYIGAVFTILSEFTNLAKNERPEEQKTLTICKNTIALIDKFLDQVKNCVVSTGSADDAYTLFEVLNDRAVALTDYDLIKNQFYKKFCQTNSDLMTSQQIDDVIQDREDQWGNQIFISDIRKQDAQMIAYFGASFLTGDKTLRFGDAYRKSFSSYLDSYDKQKLYKPEYFKRDYNILECINFLVSKEALNLPAQKKHQQVILTEYLFEFSDIYRTLQLLNALNQQGVMAGLIAILLKYIQLNITDTFEPDKCRQFIKEIVFKKNIENHNNFDDIESLSRRIWKISMQSKNAEKPREVSTSLIEKNTINSERIDLNHNHVDDEKLKEDFKEWLNEWMYGSNDLKIKVLFGRVIKYATSELKNSKFEYGATQEEIQGLHLDHLEPQNPDKSRKEEEYFRDVDREFYVNGLGNMMPLTASENISKGNKPFIEAFTALEKTGLGNHWMTNEIKETFLANQKNKVPKKEFFTERRKSLIELFIRACSC